MLNSPDAVAGKLHHVFAGQETLNWYQQVHVKSTKGSSTTTRASSHPRVLDVTYPGREVVITGRTSKSACLPDETFDVIIPTMRDMELWRTLNVQFLLFNPIHATRSLCTKAYRAANIETIFDSGGFQIAQGTSDFVSPDEVASMYTTHATIGMGLDLPATPVIDKYTYKPRCHHQARNNDYIRSQVNDTVSVAPVIHGATLESRLYCLKTNFQPKRDKVLALAGLVSKRGDTMDTTLSKVSTMFAVMEKTRGSVAYYHLLGSTSVLWYSIMSMLTLKGYVTSVGGDSVSHRQSAIGGSYELPPFFSALPALSQPIHSTVAGSLPCSCPVCHHLGDARMLRDFRLSELHHTYVTAKFRDFVHSSTRAYIAGSLSRSEYVVSLMGRQPGLTDSNRLIFNAVLDYIEETLTKGFKPKALKSKAASMFSSTTVSTRDRSVIDRYTKIMKDYDAWFKNK